MNRDLIIPLRGKSEQFYSAYHVNRLGAERINLGRSELYVDRAVLKIITYYKISFFIINADAAVAARIIITADFFLSSIYIPLSIIM